MGGNCLGAVAATAMHDMLNVLAGIQETVGLMEDLLCRCKLDAATLQARFATMAPAMRQQVGRGVIVAEALNRLGNQLADPESRADVASLARLMLLLTARKARMRKLTLAVEETCLGPVCAGAGPQAVVAALCVILDACYALLLPGTEMRLKVGRDGATGFIRFASADAAASQALAAAARDCPALPEGLAIQPEPGAGGACLVFPCSPVQTKY